MTNTRASRQAACGAFTLIELLVVIAIIAILAALIFPAAGAIKRRATITKVQAELKQVTTFIDLYKEKHGFYPPDNPVKIGRQFNYATNQLYYELMGTTLNGSTYQTLDGGEQILVANVPSGFRGNVAGFVNCTKGAGDDNAAARNFLKGLKPGQSGLMTNSGIRLRLLTCSVTWPTGPFEPINPWVYNSSNPTNNPGSYDLCVDVLIAGKTNRISNWSQQPQLVGQPYPLY